jgi:triosephosphate isomerase
MIVAMKTVIANLKMNFVTKKECNEYLSALSLVWKNRVRTSGVEVIVCPSLLFIELFSRELPKGILLGSQDIFWEHRGSFTGQTSPDSLVDASVVAVLCGHSEQRNYANESDDMISKKVKSALESHLRPIVCVGETKEEKIQDETMIVIAEQVRKAIESVLPEEASHLILAYEPRWAIGSSVTPTSDEIFPVRILIQKILVDKYGETIGHQIPVLYGGSVNASIIKKVCVEPQMSGVLVGKESLRPEELLKIIDQL